LHGLCGFMMFNATFNNISSTSWRSVLLVEETGVPWENHWPVASHWQTLSHNVVMSSPFHISCMYLIWDQLFNFEESPSFKSDNIVSCWWKIDLYNLIKIISLLLLHFTDILQVGRSEESPLQVMCEWPYVPANKNGNCKNRKMFLNCFACYEQSDWLQNIFIISLYIHYIKSLTHDP
jgi:hypothetical protein